MKQLEHEKFGLSEESYRLISERAPNLLPNLEDHLKKIGYATGYDIKPGEMSIEVAGFFHFVIASEIHENKGFWKSLLYVLDIDNVDKARRIFINTFLSDERFDHVIGSGFQRKYPLNLEMVSYPRAFFDHLGGIHNGPDISMDFSEERLKDLLNPPNEKNFLHYRNEELLFDRSIEESNMINFGKGMEILNELDRGPVSFNYTFKKEEGGFTPLGELFGEKKRIKDEISKCYSGGNNRLLDNLKHELNDLEAKIVNEKMGQQANYVMVLLQSCVDNGTSGPWYEVTLRSLEFVLDQLVQHKLKGRLRERSKKIVKGIFITEKDLDANSVKLSIYDKYLGDVPTFKKYGCCSFLEGTHGNVFEYILDPEIQLMKIEVGNGTAMAIMVDSYNEDNERVLLIDSVESKSHMFNREEIISLVDKGFQDYAKDNDFTKIFYAKSEWNNSSHREFLSNLSGNLETMILYKEGMEVYLEANLGGEIEGYSRRLD